MVKEFKMNDKELVVTINNEADIFLPKDGEQIKVGKFKQKTTQFIDKDKVSILQEFVNSELDKAVKQEKALLKQYEPIKDIVDLDPIIVEATKKALEKGTKAFKDKAVHLSNHIGQMNNKNVLKTQLDYISKQIVEIKKDADGLTKAIK